MKHTFTKLCTALLLGSAIAANAQTPKEPKVLFIGIDGVRYDGLGNGNTPTIDSLMNIGLFTKDSWHCGITMSGPSWSTMMTGVWETKHKITNNNYTNADFANFPYFPKRAKECRPDLKAVEIITWDPMNDPTNSNNTAGYVTNSGFDQSIDAGTYGQGSVTAAAKLQLNDPNLDILFIHYDEVDAAGHGSGFNPTNPAYINAIKQVDSEIRQVLDKLYSRANIANEDWIVMLTTDHGGLGNSHGGNSITERHIWWIAAGANIPHLEITGSDPGSYQMPSNPVDPAKLKNTPVLPDIAVTALGHLLKYNTCDPETNPVWKLDGKSWVSKAQLPSYVEAVTNPAVEFGIFPNPNNGAFKTAFRNTKGQVNFHVVNSAGQMLVSKTAMADQSGNLIEQFDLSTLPNGMYYLQVENNGKHTTRKIVINK